MKKTSTALAKVCVALLVLYPVLAGLVLVYLAPGSYGILAALLAANTGTAVFVGLALYWPDLSHCTSRELRLVVAFTGVVSALASAVFWLVDEVDHSWLHVVIIAPVLVILLVLILFVRKVEKEGTKHEGE